MIFLALVYSDICTCERLRLTEVQGVTPSPFSGDLPSHSDELSLYFPPPVTDAECEIADRRFFGPS